MNLQKKIIVNTDILLGVLLVLIKIFFLEIDPPNWLFAYYQPIDEMYYTQMAYDFIDYKEFFFKDKNIFIGNPFLTNIMGYITLNIFGDNYFGLRIGSVFFGILIIYLFILILRRFVHYEIIRFLIIIFFGLNFSFTMASIYVEPTISRTFSLMMVIYLVITTYKTIKENPQKMLFINMLIFIILLFTYPTNLFTLLATYIVFVLFPILNLSKKIVIYSFLVRNIYYVFSIIVPFIVLWAVFLLFDINIFESMLKRGDDYSERVGFSLNTLYTNFITIGKSNIFIFNPLISIFSFFSISLCIIKIIQKKYLPIEVLIVFVFLISFFTQTLFINDFPQRKLIIILPLLLLLISWYTDHVFNKKIKINKVLIVNFLGALLILIILFVILNNLKRSIGSISLFLGIILLFFIIIKKKLDIKKLYIFFFLLISSELFFCIDNYIIGNTYYYKETLKKLSKYNNKEFIGGFSLGFRAYNNIKPIINPYFYYNDNNGYDRRIEKLSCKDESNSTYMIDYDTNVDENKMRGFIVLDTLMEYNKTVNFSKKSVFLYINKCSKR